ncbi:MAG TPA: sortase [Candidatus Paceibacterota bacterium]|nr:sortase [Candidatus Paceibacterota bacterium]
MRLHNRSRAVMFRLAYIFVATFAVVFLLLNYRFVEQNVQYVIAPATIRSRNTLDDAIRLLPISQAVVAKPLPDQATLIIDSIGVRAPIVFNTPDDTDMIYDRLEDGVVHYSGTSKPGDGGVSIVLGHSSAYPWYKGDYGAVFALLSKLQPGDRFYIQYSDNRSFFYEMKENLIFNPFKGDERLTAMERASGDNVILISCYPVGTNYLRIAVRAEQITI